jgi:hypothetical protein
VRVIHHRALIHQSLESGVIVRAEALEVFVAELVDNDGDHQLRLRRRRLRVNRAAKKAKKRPVYVS